MASGVIKKVLAFIGKLFTKSTRIQNVDPASFEMDSLRSKIKPRPKHL